MNFLHWNMYDSNNDMNLWERIADTLWTLSWYNDYADERRHVLLFSILILGQNVVSYNVQNELRLVRKGFPLRYSLKEKITMQVSYWKSIQKQKSKWKIIYFIHIPDRYAEHDTHKAVSIQNSWNRCVRHGQTVLKHFQILCQI